MISRFMAFATATFAAIFAAQTTSKAQSIPSSAPTFTEALAVEREQLRPDAASLPVPPGFTREQILLGDRVFHGEAAGGQCSQCHGLDAKGTPVGNDLTTGMYIWGDGSMDGIKRTIMHNMTVAPGMDGNLRPTDVDAVAAYVWALGRRNP
jgi:hypothetical protein